MGMDLIELVMEIEEEFAISIPDSEAEKLQTVGQTADYVVTCLRARERPGRPVFCASARAFYELRSAMYSRFGVERGRIRPSAAVGDLIPAGPGRAQWPDFAWRNGLPVPPFRLRAPFAARFPEPATTIAQLIRASRRRANLFTSDGRVDPEAVYRRVCTIVSEQLGVDESNLQRHTHYIDDLHAD